MKHVRVDRVAKFAQAASRATRGVKAFAFAVMVCCSFSLAAPGQAQEAGAAENTDAAQPTDKENKTLNFEILYLKQLRDDNPPLSLLDLPAPDEGVAGARLGLADNNTTGQFLNQKFSLDLKEAAEIDGLISAAKTANENGTHFIVADLEPNALLKLADALKDSPVVIFNAGSNADRLRGEDCRANVFHTAPSNNMLSDALAQYLVWKRWRKWYMIVGPMEKDKELAESYRRAAKKFGAKIVEEREFEYEPGSRRADGGFEQIQQQIPQFTQKAPDHDVVIVLDAGSLFAEYFPYRVWTPRPVAGSAGLVPASWHPALELWGGTQFQNRFRRLANRNMTTLDYNAWVATRAVGEAASRTQTADFEKLHEYIHSPKFEVAAFKGVKTTFRTWDGQLRQPLIVTTPKLLVSVSPQPGFLHQRTELDTLGVDKPETNCQAYKE